MQHRVSELDHGKLDTGKRPIRTCHTRMCVHTDVCGGSSPCPCRLHTKTTHELGTRGNLEETAGAILLMQGLTFLTAKLPPAAFSRSHAAAWEYLPCYLVDWAAGDPWWMTVEVKLLASELTFQRELDQASSSSVSESFGRKLICIEHICASIPQSIRSETSTLYSISDTKTNSPNVKSSVYLCYEHWRMRMTTPNHACNTGYIVPSS